MSGRERERGLDIGAQKVRKGEGERKETVRGREVGKKRER